MRNIGMVIEYEGTRYSGWQKQKNTQNTIQQKLELIINSLFNDNDAISIDIHASGRTDTGVHARGQMVNFWVDTNMNTNEIKDNINKYLPDDIRIIKVEDKAPRFHSRLNAKNKTYKYYIDTGDKCDVFLRKYSWNIKTVLDINKMINASKLLIGSYDYIGFSDMRRTKKSTVREIYSIRITEDKGIIELEYKGSGFLYHMIRILTAYLVSIGLGKIELEEINKILDNKIRDKNIQLAPAQGLFLEKIEY